MTWKTIYPIMQFIDRGYSNGVTMTKQAFQAGAFQLELPSLVNWCLMQAFCHLRLRFAGLKGNGLRKWALNRRPWVGTQSCWHL